MSTRRPKGSGSLRQLDGERWQLTVKVADKRHSRVFTARNATEAHKMSAEIRREIDEAIRVAGIERSLETVERDERKEFTLERYVAYYFSEWADHRLAATTRQSYRLISKNQVVPRLGAKKMRDVTPADLSKLYAALGQSGARRNKTETGGLSDLYIWHVHTFVEALFTFAVRQEDVDQNPARRAKPTVPRRAAKTTRALEVTEVEQLLRAVRLHDPSLYLPVMVSAYLGTRRGELCGLRWADLDTEKGEVTIRRSVSRTTPEGLVVKTTKTGKVRTIPLDQETLTELETYRKAQRRERMVWGPGWAGAESAENDYICTSADGSVMNPDHFTHQFRAFATAHGFEAVTPHALRHAFVSQLIALGFDAVTISSMSGHSPDVLLNVYAHAFDKRKREAMEALGAVRKLARAAG